jgi:predicted RNase H-like nuclease
MKVAGIDGFKRGWVVVIKDGSSATIHCVPDFPAVLAITSDCDKIAIDMPVGFLDCARARGRECEKEARLFLGSPKSRSVFSSPVRPGLVHDDYPSALAVNRAAAGTGIGINKQTFCLFPKMNDIDAVITPALQDRCKEIHPEVSFTALRDSVAAGDPDFVFLESKKPRRGQQQQKPLGQKQREDLLSRTGFVGLAELLADGKKKGAKPDDILDACVAAWSAERIHLGIARSLPSQPPRDSRGLEMAIWY